MENVVIGIDLGGTNLRIGAVTGNNEVLAPCILKTELIAEADDPMQMLCKIIEDYCKDCQIQKIDAISIGVPSSVERDKATVICTTNIRNKAGEVVFSHINMAQDIERTFQVPVFVNNDVNNIMLYDIMANNLEKQHIVVGIYIGTGVGAAVVIDGKPLEGKNGAELDLGHIPYFGGEVQCSCGKKGCCECYASGWRLQEIRKEYYPDVEIGDLFTLYKEEKPICDFIEACANVYAIMATIFNPDTMIVGGGVPEMTDFPKERFEQKVNSLTGTDVMNYGFDYVYSKPFVGKGVIGAAIFARKQLKNE